MSSRRGYRLLVGALTALLAIAPASPALASDCWPERPPCANGAITSAAVLPTSQGGDVVIRMSGWSALCPGAADGTEGYKFGLLLYSAGGSWLARLTEYQGLGLQPFTYNVDYTRERPFGPARAACLAYDYNKRLSCVSINFIQTPAVQPIPTDHPWVNFEELTAPCGHCVSEPGITRN